ncbi:DUF2007 domain-containing protein [Desulfovibrio sp. OttesenSCG-928-C06]|nr:DUF2007 domain-containing protein [Desulfovibrio sp. OttesenSCG-928-C06]
MSKAKKSGAELVRIASFLDLGTAYVARSQLEGCGIRCFLANEHTVSIQPLYANALQGIELMVFAADAEEAASLLRNEFAPEDLLAEEKDMAPELETALFEPEATCPSCASPKTRRIWISRLFLLFTWLTGIPLGTRRPVYRCGSCGHVWRETPDKTTGADKPQ